MAVDVGNKDQVTRMPGYGCPHSTVNLSFSAILVLGEISLVLTLSTRPFPTEPTGVLNMDPWGSKMTQAGWVLEIGSR